MLASQTRCVYTCNTGLQAKPAVFTLVTSGLPACSLVYMSDWSCMSKSGIIHIETDCIASGPMPTRSTYRPNTDGPMPTRRTRTPKADGPAPTRSTCTPKAAVPCQRKSQTKSPYRDKCSLQYAPSGTEPYKPRRSEPLTRPQHDRPWQWSLGRVGNTDRVLRASRPYAPSAIKLCVGRSLVRSAIAI